MSESDRVLLDPSLEQLPAPVYRTAPDGTILAVNQALADMLGYAEPSQVVGMSVLSTYRRPKEREAWVDRIARTRTVADLDVELVRSDGTTVWVRDSGRAVHDPEGRLLYYEGVLLDVSDKEAAERSKNLFIATVSHELRTPLAAVLGLGRELADGYESFSDEERRELAELIAQQAEEASWLVEDLLIAFRDDPQKVNLAIEPFDVVEEVEAVLDVIDDPVDVEVAAMGTVVTADPRRTRQILRNLIGNAVKYGGGDIVVRVTGGADQVDVAVMDSGPEIPAGRVDSLFLPFERGEGHHNPASVGLGLSVARRLAILMDGELGYRYQDGWSTFYLTLPAA